MTRIKRCRNFQDFGELDATEDTISLFAQFAIRICNKKASDRRLPRGRWEKAISRYIGDSDDLVSPE